MISGSAPSVLRVARATNAFGPLLTSYRDGLGFSELGRFEDYDGFDGIVLGHRGWPYHLEFTIERGRVAPKSVSSEQLLVFYLPDEHAWQTAIDRLTGLRFQPVVASNPFWDRQGKTFEDPDGFRIVLQNSNSPF